MANGKYVGYFRVSTTKQGASGLGLEGQRSAVISYLNGVRGELLAEFTEVETGRGSNALDKRPQLRAALAAAKKAKATLIIAKLDRLARNVHFVSGLIETGVEFVAADMPNANKTMLHIHATIAEWERDAISARTKAALAAAKARGVVLGKAGASNLRPNIEARQDAAKAFAERLRPSFNDMKERGLSQRDMAKELNSIGVRTPKGGAWRLEQVRRIISRLDLLKQPGDRG